MGFGVQSDFFNWTSPEFAKAQPIWGSWDCLWPFLVKQDHFWGVLGPPGANFGGKKVQSVQLCSTNVQHTYVLGLLGLPIMAIFGP